MEKSKINRLQLSVIFSLLLVFGFYTSTIMYADAVSVATSTFATGTTTNDVAYENQVPGSDTSTAYIIGQNAGQAYAWKKGATTQNILFNVTLTGSGSGRAIEYNQDQFAVYAVTNDKIWKLSQSLGIAGSLATGTAASIIRLFYDQTNEILYYCTNDGYGTVNVSTLALTSLYTDPGVNSVFGCDFAVEDGFVFLSGDAIGTGAGFDLIGISLATHTQYDGVSLGADFFYGNCADPSGNFVWGMYSSAGVVRKYDMATLTQQASVTVGTTPRHCSINTDDTGRRLYVANEGSNTVSILDIDANVVLTSPAVCDTAAGRYLDTKRLSNTTNTFITCNSNVNSVIIDDTVSDFQPEPSETGCDNPANANLLRCVLGDDEFTGIGDAVGDGLINIGCNVIFQDCSESDDPAVNGMGLLAFIASIFIVIGMFYWAMGRDAFQMPVFIWIVIVIALSAFFTLTGLIDPIFLILSIIAVIALAAPKVVGQIQNRGFGGGSSE